MSRSRSGGWPLQSVFDACSEQLFGAESTDTLFNPYLGENPDYDCRGAAQVRRSNLAAYFRTYRRRPDVVVLAEAPGPWGCRFSGVPITSEKQLVDRRFPLVGGVSSNRGTPYSEYSARIFWRTMLDYFPRFIVWNALPLHPHRKGEPTSIRTPRVSELRLFSGLTRELVESVRPAVVVALGRKAEWQLGELGIGCRYVRHPSQGGAKLFEEGMKEVFGGIA